MTRPIIWAVATCGAIALAAHLAGERLSRLADARSVAARSYVSATTSPRTSAGTDMAARIVTVDGDRRGHFAVDAALDGRRVTMLVDTGASIVALTHEDALASGIRPFPSDYTTRIGTANGTVSAAPVRIREMRVGDIQVRDVEAVVMPAGRLGTSLLGMSFLRQLRGFDIAGNRLTLRG